MDKEELKNRAKNPNLIPGIYNYCDRWCERCQFTSRCLQFEIEDGQNVAGEELDIHNEAFWEKLSGVFQTTLELVAESAEEMGIDLDYEGLTDDRKSIELAYESAKKHPCATLSTEYIELVKSWMESSQSLFGRKAEELILREKLGLNEDQLLGDAASIAGAREVILWYQFFIHVKIMRALGGKIEEVPENPQAGPHDFDGSAKIALIAIERSISAWGILLSNFPEEETGILNILALLQRLYKLARFEFPAAMEFVRPGFDE